MDEQNKDCGCNTPHNHDDECGCGCGHDHEHGHEVELLRLVLDDETEMDCYVLGVYEVKGKNYIALLPTEEEQVLLYEYNETEDGIELINIEDDAVFEEVARAFEEAELNEEEGD